MHFIKYKNITYMFHTEQLYNLACYMVSNERYVQALETQVLITCNQTFSVKGVYLSDDRKPMLDLRNNLDVVNIWRLGQAIQQSKEVIYGT